MNSTLLRSVRATSLLVALVACQTRVTPEPEPEPSTASRAVTDPSNPLGVVDTSPATYWGDRVKPTFPASWPYPAGRRATFGPHAMIASDAPLAGRAGVEILQQGGNAVDAAVAVGFALAVVYPEAGNVGGGGYMVIRMADGRQAALDYREVAPKAATRNLYLDSTGALTDRSIVGPLASGVPGAVAGLVAAQQRFGKLTLAQVMAPAIRYADSGFTVDSAFARSVTSNASLIAQFQGAHRFLPGGKPVATGTLFRQPVLAQTLKRIASQGAAGFYEGATARAIANEMKWDGGIITEADLAAYKPIWREPITSRYHGHTLLTMPPSSSGGATITESLNILAGYVNVAPFGSTEWAHRIGSAYQRAFIDRNSQLADPAFYPVPLAKLTSPAYGEALRLTINPNRARPTSELVKTVATIREGTQTTHYSVVDAEGNAVATTTTLNALYGSGVYVREGGFFLNDEMDDFAAKPGSPNMFGLVQGEANAVQPGKRMLSAMSPTIVLDSTQRVELVVGSRGGPRIITSTSQVILNVIDQHMILSDAMSAPRLHHQALPDTLRYEDGGVTPAVLDSLRAMGWAVAPVGSVGLVNGVMRVPAGWEGFSDPRSSGRPVGY